MTKTLGDFGEFAVIARLAAIVEPERRLIGDDCAILECANGTQLAVSSDSMVDKVHFELERISAEDLGWKLHASTVSDLAAVGADPLAIFINLQLPKDFSLDILEGVYRGLRDASQRYGASVAGGDLTRSQTAAFSATAIGLCSSKPVMRSGAQVGDDVWVSGVVGLSSAGLRVMQGTLELEPNQRELAVAQHYRPEPRVQLGARLAKLGIASSMIDLSDGLIQDAGHIAEESACEIVLRLESVPRPAYAESKNFGLVEALSGGEDYELLFTAGGQYRAQLEELSASNQVGLVRLSRIGEVRAQGSARLLVLTPEGEELASADWLEGRGGGFDHFS